MTILTLLSLALIQLCDIPDFALENPCNVMVPRNADGDWGFGAVYVPASSHIAIYENERGEIFGHLQTDQNGFCKIYHGVELINLQHAKDFESIGGINNILIKARKSEHSEFINILWKSKEGGLFLKKSQLEQSNILVFNYSQLLFSDELPLKIIEQRAWANLGVNLHNSCLNLRTEPSVQADKVVCLPSNDWNFDKHTHLKILECQNGWAKVTASDYNYDPSLDESGEGCTFIKTNEYEGWVKAID